MKLKSVKSLGIQDVFDVIDSETSNFLLDNEIVVHNSAAIDEAAFLEVIEESKRGETDVEGIYDQAEQVYHATRHRMRSRFKHKDKGMIVMVSSMNHPDDFVLRKAKAAYNLEDDEIYMSILPEWRVKPTAVYFPSNKFFYFDTEKLEIIEHAEEIEALDKNYVATEPVDILFGDVDDDPNDKLLKDMRDERKMKKLEENVEETIVGK